MTKNEIIKTVAIALIEVAVGVAVYFALKGLYGKQTMTQPRQADTTTVYDTIPYYMPVAVDSLVVRYDTVRLPSVRDTITHTEVAYDTIIRDSVMVSVPITQKRYEDSTYTAWVSGFRPQLDSIKVYRKTTTITNNSRIGLGFMGGYGFGKGGLTPFFGVGFFYRLF